MTKLKIPAEITEKMTEQYTPYDVTASLKTANIELPTLRKTFIEENLQKLMLHKNIEADKLDGIDQNSNEIGKNEEHVKRTDIQEFYHGKNIFVTGATGFLGKILIEKLLRCCPGVEILYLLVRQKRGKDIYTRLDEVFEDPIFSRLKEQYPKFRHKIVAVPGDCGAPGLALSITDRHTLTEKVNIMFHSAATVKFDEHLRTALTTNVCAPLHILRLARDMKRLDVLMHVSTAYSNCHLTHIEERFYPCEVHLDHLSNMIDKLTDEEVDTLLPTILGPWPNTYTLTKALAEKELRNNAGNLPLGIFRPAIVTSTAKEPLRCWIDNMYGPTGVAVGSATGMLRTLQCDAAVTAEIVPGDMVVNCLLASARNVHLAHKQSKPPPEPLIFNYVSSVENRITWGGFMQHNMACIDATPLSSAVWYFSLTLTRWALLNRLYTVLLHLLPAAIVDMLAVCVGQKPKMLKVYRKIHKFSSVLSYFCTRELQFCNRRVRELWTNTSDGDREIFPFSMASVCWTTYFKGYLAGIRQYIFKEPEHTLPRAKLKWRRLYYLHQAVKTVFISLALYTVWTIMPLLFKL